MATTADFGPLLQALHRWDHAWAKKDALEMQKLLSPDCILHADGILFEHDVKGAESILDVHRRYFEKFDYKHESMTSAANPDTKAAFGFWQDHGVHRREVAGGEQGQGEAGEEGGATICGIWKLIFNQDCSQVQEIYFLRQLHSEEAHHKLRNPAETAQGGVDAQLYPSSGRSAEVEANKDKIEAARRASEGFSHIWQTGDTSKADDLMEQSVHSIDLLHGGEKKSRDEFCSMIKKVFEHWRPESSSIDVGVTPDGRTAIVHWSTQGKVPEREGSFHMFGLNVLEIDSESGKIKESAGFRQMSPVEKEKVLRSDAFLHQPGVAEAGAARKKEA